MADKEALRSKGRVLGWVSCYKGQHWGTFPTWQLSSAPPLATHIHIHTHTRSKSEWEVDAYLLGSPIFFARLVLYKQWDAVVWEGGIMLMCGPLGEMKWENWLPYVWLKESPPGDFVFFSFRCVKEDKYTVAPAAVCDTNWNMPSVWAKTFFFFVCFACSGFMCRLDIHSGQSEKSLASVPTCTAAWLGRPPLSIKCVCYQQR